MDKEALAQFITETALIYVDDILGAVLAISVLLILILFMRDKFLGRLHHET